MKLDLGEKVILNPQGEGDHWSVIMERFDILLVGRIESKVQMVVWDLLWSIGEADLYGPLDVALKDNV